MSIDEEERLQRKLDSQKKGGKKKEETNGLLDSLKEGDNLRRILPSRENLEGDETASWYRTRSAHYRVGIDEVTLACLEPGGAIGVERDDKRKRAELCPGCERYCARMRKARKLDGGTDEGKAAWRWARDAVGATKYGFLVQKPESNTCEEPKLHVAGPMIMGKVLRHRTALRKAGVDMIDPLDGRDITITKVQKSKRTTDVEYDVMPEPTEAKVARWKTTKRNILEMPTLDELMDEQFPIVSAKKFREILEAVDEDDDNGDDPPEPRRARDEDDRATQRRRPRDDDRDDGPPARRSRDDDRDDDGPPARRSRDEDRDEPRREVSRLERELEDNTRSRRRSRDEDDDGPPARRRATRDED